MAVESVSNVLVNFKRQSNQLDTEIAFTLLLKLTINRNYREEIFRAFFQ